MKKLLILIAVLISGLLHVCAQPYTVNVTTTAVPPVNPVISQYVSSGTVLSALQYGAAGTPPIQVYVQGRIECLSPAPFTIAVNPNFNQAGTISITPGIPVQLSATQLLGAFGFFNDNNLVATGVNLASLKDAGNNIKLPAGVYRICFLVKQPDAASGQPGINLSDPNLGCGNFTVQNAQPTNGVLINTIVIPPADNKIAAFIFKGAIRPTLQYNNAAGTNTQVKVFGKIERLAPAPFSISLNANYSQQQAITITAGIPLQLSPGQVAAALGNFTDNNLTISGISLNELKDGANNIVLPDGSYRICFYARYIDASGGLAANASDPAAGCASFSICASVAAPQFTQPVNNLNINGQMVTVQKVSPVVFTWTRPASTCGAQMGAVNYDFEMHEMFTGQTITDAINNPPVFIKTQLPSSTFLLDTLLYKDVLQSGKQYVIRVHANAATNAMVQKIDNNGYSRIEAFQYGEAVKPQDTTTKQDNNNPPVNNNQPPNPPNNNPPQINAVGGDCGLSIPSNTNMIAANEDLLNKEIKIGEFKLIPVKITRNNDGTYTGEGTVNWNPVIGVAKLKVAFDKIKINTDKTIFDGQLVTQTDPGVFKNENFSQLKDFAKKTGGELDKLANDVEDFINKNAGTRLLSQLTGNTPVDLPLGLNDKDLGGTKATFAIMNIVFSPKGATASVLFDINIEEANGWLTLAGSDFCIHPTGVSFSQGTLFLPTDRDFNIGSGKDALNIKFKGCPAADSTSGTYVTWNNNKLTDIMAHAELAFPQNAFVPEDDKGEITAGSVIAKIMFRFKEWHDWVANIDMPHFQIKDVKGLSFQPSTIFYDHSAKSNPSGFSYPSNWKGNKGNGFEGCIYSSLKYCCPKILKPSIKKKMKEPVSLQKI